MKLLLNAIQFLLYKKPKKRVVPTKIKRKFTKKFSLEPFI